MNNIVVAGAFTASSLYAHAINTVKMAQGFARLGHHVTIICLKPKNKKISENALSDLYGLTEPINWIQLPSNILGMKLDSHWAFSKMAMCKVRKNKPDFVYARSFVFPYLSSQAGIPTVAESHAPVGIQSEPFFKLVKATHYPSFYAWVTISELLANYYEKMGANREKIKVLYDAVDLHLFERPNILPPSPYLTSLPRVVYAGHLYDYKGIPTILNAAKLLPNVNFELVGGTPEDISRHQATIDSQSLKNVTLHGLKPQKQIPPYLWHADILLLTHTLNHPSAAWTSPLKLGEYLASGTPIIASDIPALRRYITPNEVEFVVPDNHEKLAEAISSLINEKEKSKSLVEHASRKAKDLSYEKRASTILDSVQSLNKK